MAHAISVVIPSKLERMPDGSLYLERCIRAIEAQTLEPAQIVVGLDEGVEPPDIKPGKPEDIGLWFENWRGRGHQGACNAAASVAYGYFLSVCEDDDVWLPTHLEACLAALQHTDAAFCSCSQREVRDGVPGEPFDFPTMSSWFLRRRVWMDIGGVDERFRIHHDNAALAEINKRKVPRVHLIERDAAISPERSAIMEVIGRHARIMHMDGDLTVLRDVRGESIMGHVGKSAEWAKRSHLEYCAVEVLYESLENGW